MSARGALRTPSPLGGLLLALLLLLVAPDPARAAPAGSASAAGSGSSASPDAPRTPTPAQRVGLLVGEANTAGATGDHAGAEAKFREALALAREVGDPLAESQTLSFFAALLVRLGRAHEVTPLGERQLALAEEMRGTPATAPVGGMFRAAGLQLRAMGHMARGDFRASGGDLRRAIEAFGEVPVAGKDPRPDLRLQIAALHLELGQWSKALDVCEGLRGEPVTSPAMLAGIQGVALAGLGRMEEARQKVDEARALAESSPSGDPQQRFGNLAVIGEAYLALDLPEEAVEVLEEGLAPYQGEPPEKALVLIDGYVLLAAARVRAGQAGPAAAALRKARAMEARLGIQDHPRQVWMDLTSARLLLARKSARKAGRYANRARKVATERLGPAAPDLVEALRLLAEAWRDLGDGRRSRAALTRALAVARKLYGDDHPKVRALRSLGSWFR